jgi:hypothetical protein
LVELKFTATQGINSLTPKEFKIRDNSLSISKDYYNADDYTIG